MKRFATVTALTILLCLVSLGAKGKKGPKDPASPPAAAPAPELPQDLNLASLRIRAIDTIYELDLSPAQLKTLSNMSNGTASDQKREPAVGNDKLVTAFDDFNKALLARQDDDQIAKLRSQLAELVTGDDVHLDDIVEATDAARGKSLPFLRRLTVGQIAAYIALHADQIADPVEKMMSVLTELHESGNANAADAEIHATCEEISRQLAGRDDKKAAALADQITAWFKDNKDLSDDDLVSKHDALEDEAKKIVGNDGPLDMLNKWLNNEMALLLSNPQLPDAIAAVLAQD